MSVPARSEFLLTDEAKLTRRNADFGQTGDFLCIKLSSEAGERDWLPTIHLPRLFDTQGSRQPSRRVLTPGTRSVTFCTPMKLTIAICVLFILVSTSAVRADVGSTFDLIRAGAKLSEADADKLERAIEKHPDDRTARIKLLSYWSSRPDCGDADPVKSARARHALWLIERLPQDDLFKTNSRIADVYTSGKWADSAAFEAGKKLWLENLRTHPDDREMCLTAASWMAPGAPEEAERVYAGCGNARAVGVFYADTILGIVAFDHQTADPVLSDETRRNGEFAKIVRGRLDSLNDADVLPGAAFRLAWMGGILYADGKLDWDYSALLRPLLARARAARPADLTLFTVTDTLPIRGQRPARVLQVGGNVQQAKLVDSVAPSYPPDAKAGGIEGTVRLKIVVGPTGDVVHAIVLQGPPELASSALSAVRQWRYQPTLLMGQPVNVITTIDVNYRLKK